MFLIKDNELKMYAINEKYRRYLYKYDKRVSMKSKRKFYGILVSSGSIEYYIPFTSKSEKKTNNKLTINIRNNKKEIIAKLLLNNMIPVNTEDVNIVDISKSKYYEYYMNEIRYLRQEKVKRELINKINYMHNVLANSKHFDHKFFKSICCNFKYLEKKCNDYSKYRNK